MMESGMADSLGSEIDEDVIKDLELPCTIAVYEDDILPGKDFFRYAGYYGKGDGRRRR